MMNKGKLFLIPAVISDNTHEEVIGLHIRKSLPEIRHFLAENVRTARRFLSSLKVYDNIESLNFSVLDKDTREDAMAGLLDPIMNGHNVGILSESGCPGIADPGALAAGFAHRHGIQVIPLVGPSSIILALMASGLNGQQFAFHGYLPIEGKEAGKVLRELEKESSAKKQTQIFIETPFRNNAMLRHLLKNLQPETNLCIALDVTGEKEFISMRAIHHWRLQIFELPKSPAVFLFLA